MKTVLSAFLALGVLLPHLALAQLQPLGDDDPATSILSGLAESLMAADEGPILAFVDERVAPDADSEALRKQALDVRSAVHDQEGAFVDGLFRVPGGELVARLGSEAGLVLFVAVDANVDDATLSGMRLPVGGWAPPPPPPLIEDAVPGLLDVPDTPEIVAFVNVSVIPMDRNHLLEGQTVVVRAGRIAALGSTAEVTVPDGALVVDGAGRFLMPGLSEMHAHIPSPGQGEGALERTLFLFLANGVTTIRGMLGHPAHLELRARSEAGEILAPRVYTSSPSLNGNSAPNPEVGRRLVEEHAAAGYDFLKIHPGLSRETYDAVVATARQAGIEWAGHVPTEVGLYRALEVRQVTIDHLDGYVEALAGRGEGFVSEGFGWFGLSLIDDVDDSRIPELAAATVEAGIWNVPTQSLMEHLLSEDSPEEMAAWPEMRYMPPQTVTQWKQSTGNLREQATAAQRARFLDVRRSLIGALHDAGAPLLLGADAPQVFNVPGYSVHRELYFLVASGISPYGALQSGTRNPAVYFGTDEWGTIEVGRSADLVLVDANPLDDIGHAGAVSGVMVRGHWLPRSEIDARLAMIEAALRD